NIHHYLLLIPPLSITLLLLSSLSPTTNPKHSPYNLYLYYILFLPLLSPLQLSLFLHFKPYINL
ncbi:hypothetical protein, partial [Staphylococcus epidermidis]|uniref:hypothetical protein n=1 Tax=Staphylococcus epidermidis TaxID=1282 RepID=UPI001C92F2BB